MFYVIDQTFQGQFGDKITHGYFTRRGGVSLGIYDSLNCGQGSDDDEDAVQENKARVAAELGVEKKHLLTLRQIHSDNCVLVKQPWHDIHRPQVDAMVTDVPGIALGILTADCAPVLLYGESKEARPVIGAVHAGWRGSFDGVLAATVKKMGELGVSPDFIHASIGPCIGLQSYEVGEEFHETFLKRDTKNGKFFVKADEEGKFRFSLPAFVKAQLRESGVKRISHKNIDTYFNEEDFFSYRRSVHRSEPDYGRQISAIVIRQPDES